VAEIPFPFWIIDADSTLRLCGSFSRMDVMFLMVKTEGSVLVLAGVMTSLNMILFIVLVCYFVGLIK